MSDTTKLLDAAKRLEEAGVCGINISKISDVFYDDCRRVAKHILATVCPDDGDTVNREWLESVGGQFGKNNLHCNFQGQDQTLLLFQFARPTETWTASIYDETAGEEVTIKPNITTRGAFRALCKCLGVELKEPAEQASN